MVPARPDLTHNERYCHNLSSGLVNEKLQLQRCDWQSVREGTRDWNVGRRGTKLFQFYRNKGVAALVSHFFKNGAVSLRTSLRNSQGTIAVYFVHGHWTRNRHSDLHQSWRGVERGFGSYGRRFCSSINLPVVGTPGLRRRATGWASAPVQSSAAAASVRKRILVRNFVSFIIPSSVEDAGDTSKKS
jgi:hypothetical protein